MKVLNFTAIEILPSLLDKTKTQTIRKSWKENEEHILNCPVCYSIKELKRRKVRNITPDMLGGDVKFHKKVCNEVSLTHPLFIEKPPRFVVGDKIKLLWNKYSKYDWFCKWCGGALIPDKEDLMTCTECLNAVDRDVLNNYEMYHKRGEIIPNAIIFNKLLGTATISEIFKILITNEVLKRKMSGVPYIFKLLDNGRKYGSVEFEEDLAKRDGFKGIATITSEAQKSINHIPKTKVVESSAAEEMFKYFDKKYDLSSAREFYVYRWKND